MTPLHGFARGRFLLGLGVVLVLSLPVAAAPDLRFDLRPQKEHLRMVGKDLAAMLPPGARLGIIDPKGNGLAALMVRYELTKDSTPGKAPSVPASYDFADRDKSLKDFMAQA
jgi:hypothetical protein